MKGKGMRFCRVLSFALSTAMVLTSVNVPVPVYADEIVNEAAEEIVEETIIKDDIAADEEVAIASEEESLIEEEAIEEKIEETEEASDKAATTSELVEVLSYDYEAIASHIDVASPMSGSVDSENSCYAIDTKNGWSDAYKAAIDLGSLEAGKYKFEMNLMATDAWSGTCGLQAGSAWGDIILGGGANFPTSYTNVTLDNFEIDDSDAEIQFWLKGGYVYIKSVTVSRYYLSYTDFKNYIESDSDVTTPISNGEDAYTAGWSDFKAAYDDAVDYINNHTSSDANLAEMYSLYKAVDSAISGLVLGMSLDDLTNLIADNSDADKINKLSAAEFVDGYTAFKTAYNAAKALVDAGSTNIGAITRAYNNLVDAMDALVRAKTVNMYVYSDGFEDVSEWEIAADADNHKEYILNNGAKLTKAFTDEKDFWYVYELKLLVDTLTGSMKAGDFGYAVTDAAWAAPFPALGQYNSNTTALFTAVKAAANGDSFYMYPESRAYGGTYTYATSKDDASLTTKIKTNATTKLSALVSDIEGYSLDEEDYSPASFARLQAALTAAKAIGAGNTVDEILTAYFELESAYTGLMSKNVGEVNVQKVPNLDSEFAYGGDISSFYALMQAGTVFKDENGKALTDQEFFNYLYDGGMNYARIRIFNDPYDSSGNGYGGGNNDLEKAVAMGKLATNAGMKVLIDFHYSDFWADPSKYKVPKAWATYTKEEKAEALYNFTYDSLKTLLDAGVKVEMVQVGNESNHGLAGETDGNATILYGYGCEAVNKINEEYEKSIRKAVHFTDVQQGGGTVTSALTTQLGGTYKHRNDDTTAAVDYDAVGVSYYPMYRHGDIANLETVLKKIKSDYDKDVFVAETSWATTWGDGDGFSNSGPSLEGQDIESYSISVQGQADELRAVVNATSAAAGIGVFYWEPAWIAPYVATYDDFTWNEENYAKNKEAWEKYGIGWASSFSYEYDPTDAGLYYGGIGVDNMAWFDFTGKALPTAKIYKLIKEGASKVETGELVSVQKNQKLDVILGEEVPYPATVKGYLDTFSIDGATVDIPVEWNVDDKEKVNTEKAGYYTVNGIATYTDGTQYAVSLTIEIVAANNVKLTNGDFESFNKNSSNSSFTSWDIRAKVEEGEYITSDFHGSGKYLFSIEVNNARNGNGALNFWRSDADLNMTITQQLDALDAGTYTFGGYFEGGSAGEYDTQYAIAYVYDNKATYDAEVSGQIPLGTNALAKYKNGNQFGGWLNWKNVEIKDIQVEDGQFVVVGFEFNGTPIGVWGSVDDAYMYGNYGVTVADSVNGTVEVSDYTPNTNAKVTISAKADKNYTLKNIEATVSTGDISEVATYFTDYGWVVDGSKVVYTPDVSEKTAPVVKAKFKMPAADVNVVANFENPVVEDANINDATVISVGGLTAAPYNFVATGKAFTPEVVLNYNGYVLTKSDFAARYENNTNPGEATITLTGKGRFTGTKEIKFNLTDGTGKVIDKDFTVVWRDFDDTKGYFYTGSEITPVTDLKDASGSVVSRANYKVSYDKNVKVGSATAIITGTGAYTGSLKVPFKIVKADISVLKTNGTLKLNGKTGDAIDTAVANGTYIDGSKAVTPGLTIYDGATMLKQKKDYTVSYKNNKEITLGTDNRASVTIKGTGNYTGTLTLEFDVEPKSINDEATIRVVVDDMVESNTPKAPKVTVYYKSNSKTEKKVKANNYYIAAVNKVSGNELIPVDDNKVSEAGNYKVTVSGNNNLKDSRDIDFRVVDKNHILSKSNVKFGKIYYTGKAITISSNSRVKPDESELKTVSVNAIKVIAGDTVLKLGRDYDIVEYKNNQKAGTATIRIVGMGEYAGEFTADFKINKLKMVEPEKYAALVNDGNAVGYATTDLSQMDQRRDSTYGYMHYFTGYKLTPEYDITVSANGMDTIKVTQNKDYKLAYTNNTKPNDFDGDGNCDADQKPIVATIGGMNNYSGSVKVTMDGNSTDDFAITARTIKDFTVLVTAVDYSGNASKPVPTFIDKEKGIAVYMHPSTYTVKHYNNKKVAGGTDENVAPYAIVTAKGDFAKGLSAAEAKTDKLFFNIAAATITLSDVEKIKPQTYKDGKAVEPKVKVKVNGKSLSEGKDYVVRYSNNCLRYAADSDEDTAAPTVTVIGIGNYTGEVSRTFTIM